MNAIIRTPEGTSDKLFERCRAQREVQERLSGLFLKRGYSEVITPATEYLEVFLRTGGAVPQETMQKLIDRKGRILTLRPDMTTPIARVFATKLRTAPVPLRLYYFQNIFRAGEEHGGRGSEIPQAGIELIGAPGIKADLEVISCAVDSFRSAGTRSFRIEIGHAGLFRALVRALGAEPDTAEEIRMLIERKNFAALNDCLEPFSGDACEALKRLIHMFGGREVLEEARSLSSDPEARWCVDYLSAVFGELEEMGLSKWVMIDLGLVHKLDYYTGVVFQGYAEGAGGVVLTGGRYDSMAGLFGREAPATGFAIDIDELCQCAAKPEPAQLRQLVHFELGRMQEALSYLDAREPGSCELSPCETLSETLELARKKGVSAVLNISADGWRDEEVIV